MADDFILQTRGLTKEFKGFVAVNQVDLKVRRGSIHALIGPNGAGKTTCFNLLTKFLTPTAGSIVFDGVDITGEDLATEFASWGLRRASVTVDDALEELRAAVLSETPLDGAFPDLQEQILGFTDRLAS